VGFSIKITKYFQAVTLKPRSTLHFTAGQLQRIDTPGKAPVCLHGDDSIGS